MTCQPPEGNSGCESRLLWSALDEAQRPLTEAHSLPAVCYHSADLQSAEVCALFHRHWLGLGRADRFTSKGQYETIDVAGVPLLLVMDHNEKLHAFNNACRHRGARLLDGAGQCRGIRCPFHSWSYKTSGEFVSAPHMADSHVANTSTLNLVEFALEIHLGFLFVCLNPEPPDFDTHIGDFDAIHSAWPLSHLVSTRRQRMEVKCNWKLFLDVFNEYYHLPFVHADSINAVYKTPEPADKTTGHYASQFGENEGTGGLLEQQQKHALPDIPGLGEQARSGTRYTWVFPNMAFAASRDALWIYEAYPLEPDRCIAYQTLCFARQSVELPDFNSKVQHYYSRFDAAVEEDRVALENQQRGLNSPFTVPGPYSSSMEPSVAAFARWYAKELQVHSVHSTTRTSPATSSPT